MRVLDLSQTLTEFSPVYPGDGPLSLAQDRFLARDGYNARRLDSGFHVATHIDIPAHLSEDTRTLDAFLPERFMGRGVLFDVRGRETLHAGDIDAERLLPGDCVLLYTGFDSHVSDYNRYFHGHPTVAPDLAALLISRKAKLLGFDMPSPDHPPYTVHKQLLAHEVFLLENLCGLGGLMDFEAFEVIALPIKVAAEAGFARAIAREM